MTTKILTKKVKGNNRHWKNFIDKDYLGSHNLEKDEEMLLTIERFEGEEMVRKLDGKKDEKVAKQVLYFKENVPKMIMNITNGNTISMLYGNQPENWVGKQLLIYAQSVKAFGKTQDALRIRDFIPKINVNTKEYTSKLDEAKDITELAKIWTALPVSARSNKEIENYKNTLKEKFTIK